MNSNVLQTEVNKIVTANWVWRSIPYTEKGNGNESYSGFKLSGPISRIVTKFSFLAAQVSPLMLKIAIRFKAPIFKFLL